jgi:hypothetical protein
MNEKLLFIQSCVKREISTDDIGYLTKWLFQDFDQSNIEYFNKVASFLGDDFFDNNRAVNEILIQYMEAELQNLQNESDLNALENQSTEQ